MLTPKQERFIQNIVSGMSQRQAYKDAYNAENMTDESIDVEACKLFNDTKISQRYQELIDKLEEETLMTAREKRRMLKEMALDTNNSVTDRIKAIDTDNKMTGEYVTKIEGDIGITSIRVDIDEE
jgi:phage terminase small subunit